MKVNDKTLQALATAINFRKLRQQMISSNIANSETPGYKAKRVDFEKALQQALDVDGTNSINTNDERHFNVGGGGFDSLEPQIYEETNGTGPTSSKETATITEHNEEEEPDDPIEARLREITEMLISDRQDRKRGSVLRRIRRTD